MERGKPVEPDLCIVTDKEQLDANPLKIEEQKININKASNRT